MKVKVTIEYLKDDISDTAFMQSRLWEFSLPDHVTQNFCIPTFLFRKAEYVKINGKTVKDRYKEPERKMLDSDWELLFKGDDLYK